MEDLNTIINISAGIGILDKNMKYTFLNQAHTEIYGYSNSEELMGKSWEILYEEDEIKRFRENILPQLKKNRSWNGTAIGKKKNGEKFDQEITLSMTKNEELICVVNDITKIKEIANELKLKNRAFEESNNSIVITDIEGNIIWVNKSFCKNTEYTKEEAKGKNPRILKSGLHPNNYYKELWDTIKSGKVWTGEIQNKTKSGNIYMEEMTITPIYLKENVITNFIAIKQNITDKKNVESHLKNKNEELERFNRLAVDRELRMIDLKKQIRTLNETIRKYEEANNETKD